MLIKSLTDLLKAQFPNASIADGDVGLHVGSFPEWDSLAHFTLLRTIEQTFAVQFSVEQMAELKSLGDIAKALTALGVAQS